MKNNNGFTLIELMFVIALSGVILLSMGRILNYNFKGFSQDSSYYKYKVDAKYAMNKVVSEIRKNSGTTFDSGKVKASDASVLVNSTANDANGGIYFYYDPDRYGIGDGYGELRRTDGTAISKNIKDFKIENADNGFIKITIKTGRRNSERLFDLVTYIRLYS